MKSIQEINILNELINLENLNKISSSVDNVKNNDQLIFDYIENINYEIFGIFYPSPVHHTIIKNDYINLWNDPIRYCINRQQYYFNGGFYFDLPFDIIILFCETFDIPINVYYIPFLIKTFSYNEDNAIYMLKSSNIKFNIKNCNDLTKIMKLFEIMYDDAIKKEYNILAKVIRTIPYFLSNLSDEKIIQIISNYPETLIYNLNINPITFNILDKSNDVISIKLKKLSNDKTFKDFQSTNKILSLMLVNKIIVPINEKYNGVFFSYYKKLLSELSELNKPTELTYDFQTNYSEKLLTLHLEIMSKPMSSI